MNSLNSLKLAELRQHELRADAGRARLAAEARRARRRRFRLDWLHQLHHIDGIHGIDRVRARWVGHQLHVDADVVLDAHLDLTRAHGILEDARHRLFHTIPRLADALLHANPTSETGDPHATTRHHLATSQPTG